MNTQILKKIPRLLSQLVTGKVQMGYCPICESTSLFIREQSWLRDHYKCIKCQSIPRQRAIVCTLNRFFPNWRTLIIHESSPCGAASSFIESACPGYSSSQFFPDTLPGSIKNGFRCENLEKMTFDSNSFDLFITQDVFEHIMNPESAFQEIKRVLRPKGSHIFTVPWYPNLPTTRQRVKSIEGELEFTEEPVYHSNPVDDNGSLVTFDYGLDFPGFIQKCSQMTTIIYLLENNRQGIEAEFLEVFISKKLG